jgi:hypothetical protein
MSISFLFFFTFRTGNIRREYMSKKGKSRIETRIVAQMSTSQGVCWHEQLYTTRFFLFIKVKRREKNKKSAGVNSRVSKVHNNRR